MSAVVRAVGTTPSERYLVKLAEDSFLDLWSYPNVYRDVVGPRDRFWARIWPQVERVHPVVMFQSSFAMHEQA